MATGAVGMPVGTIILLVEEDAKRVKRGATRAKVAVLLMEMVTVLLAVEDSATERALTFSGK
jgi:hypothetical protein